MPRSFVERAHTRTRRTWKAAWQGARTLMDGEAHSTRAVFVCGSQRSGTRLPTAVMECSLNIITYPEGNSRAFTGMFLKDDKIIENLLRRSPFPVAAFKPICESHRALEFLEAFSQSKVVWVYRGFRDTVNSAQERFRGHGGSQIECLASGDLDRADWRAGGLTPEKLSLVRKLYRPDLSSQEGHALLWYLRSGLFFELGLDEHPQSLLLKYEYLVEDPVKNFGRLFEFIDCAFEPRFVAGIYRSSVRKDPPPEISSDISELCESLEEALDEFYARTSAVEPP